MRAEVEHAAECHDYKCEYEGPPDCSHHHYEATHVRHGHHISVAHSAHGHHHGPDWWVELLKVIKADSAVIHNFEDTQQVGNDEEGHYQDHTDCLLWIALDHALEREANVRGEAIIFIA